MALTNDQRENRALYNLERSAWLTRGQLYCASVNRATIERLERARAIAFVCYANADRDRPVFSITNAGRVLLNTRIATGRASTI